ncbi:hypothetical protein ACFV0C_29115 [Streptomyces sp. NPDC059568]|uniref:hypothetical protein n=1 Tax=unclassified Streptomyces TaxID=2593676 RepID=UPI00364C3B57
MEQLGQDVSFVLYETNLTTPGHALLAITAYGDRAQVYVVGRPVEVLEASSSPRDRTPPDLGPPSTRGTSIFMRRPTPSST